MYCDWPQLGRCCFCLPLRKGVIILAFVNIVLSAFFIGLLSYAIHTSDPTKYPIYRQILDFPAEVCITMYCAEILFNVVLIYGAYKKLIQYIKIYYYFALVATIGVFVVQIIDLFGEKYYHFGMVLEMMVFIFAELSIQVYLITLVRSLIKKLEIDGPHVYDNQLHQIVTADVKIDSNGVYNNLSTPALKN